MSKPAHTAAAVSLIAPIVLCLWVVHPVLIPVALAALFAVILHPVLPWLQKRLGRRAAVAPAVLTAAASTLLILPMAFVVLMSVRTLRNAAHQDVNALRTTVGSAITGQVERLSRWAQRAGVSLDASTIRDQVVQLFESTVHGSATRIGELAASAPSFVVSVFLFFFGLYVFLGSGARLVRWMAQRIPLSAAQTQELFEQVRQAIRGVVLGSILTGVVQSALCLVVLLLLDVPGAFVWSLLAFVLSFLPMVGTTPVTVGATLYLVLSDNGWKAALMLVAAVFIGTVDNVVRPMVQGVESQLHPLLTLMAIFGGLEVMGPAGIFLGPVVAAIAQWGLETYGERGKTSAQRAE